MSQQTEIIHSFFMSQLDIYCNPEQHLKCEGKKRSERLEGCRKMWVLQVNLLLKLHCICSDDLSPDEKTLKGFVRRENSLNALSLSWTLTRVLGSVVLQQENDLDSNHAGGLTR